MMLIGHFVFTVQPRPLIPGETVRLRRDVADRVVGLDRVDETTDEVIEPIEGYVMDIAPPDERCRLPISINGVQLWRAY